MNKKSMSQENENCKPSGISPRKWNEVMTKHERRDAVYEIREEIVSEVLRRCQEIYMKKKSVDILIDCATEAWKRLIHMHHFEMGKETLIDTSNLETDEVSEPCPNDPYAAKSLPMKEKLHDMPSPKLESIDNEINFIRTPIEINPNTSFASISSSVSNTIIPGSLKSFQTKNTLSDVGTEEADIEPNEIKNKTVSYENNSERNNSSDTGTNRSEFNQIKFKPKSLNPLMKTTKKSLHDMNTKTALPKSLHGIHPDGNLRIDVQAYTPQNDQHDQNVKHRTYCASRCSHELKKALFE